MAWFANGHATVGASLAAAAVDTAEAYAAKIVAVIWRKPAAATATHLTRAAAANYIPAPMAHFAVESGNNLQHARIPSAHGTDSSSRTYPKY